MKGFSTLIFLLGFGNFCFGQDYHFIQFADKDTTGYDSPTQFLSAKSLQRRAKQRIELNERDYPVNLNYLDSLETTGATLIYSSKWLNGALVLASDEQISSISNKSFIRQNTPIIQLYGGTRVQETQEECPAKNYASANSQVKMLGADSLHSLGFAGKGMTIAVFDDGFLNVDDIPAFDSLMENHLMGTYNIVEANSDVFSSGNKSHGTNVLSTMATYLEGEIIGLAYDADYYLFVTEDSKNESPVEELNWLIAAEKADSLGVDIINSSLGYFDFNDEIHVLSYSDLDGDKAIITQAADFAASVGILVVNSAGNEGNNSWGKIAAPADADSILAVGSVGLDGNIASFSSEGPSADGRIKPDIMALGRSVAIVNSSGNLTIGSGTSYSAPIMAGFAACLWQAYPNLNNMELIEKIRQSGDLANSPNNEYGYGIPNFARFASLAGNPNEQNAFCNSNPETPTALKTDLLAQIAIFPNPVSNNQIQISFPSQMLGKQVQIRLTDLIGKTMLREEISVGKELKNLNLGKRKLESGIYILTMISEKQERGFKILIE